MDNKNSKKKMIISAAAFIAVVVGVFAYIFKGYDFNTLTAAVMSANPVYLALWALGMCCFICCESLNIGRALRALGNSNGFLQDLKYGALGFFFSGITPSASGGQPMQLYSISRDNIEISHGSLALLTEVTGFQFVNVLLATIGLTGNYSYIMSLGVTIKILVFAGLSISSGILVFLFIALFCPELADHLGNKIKAFLIRINKDKAAEGVAGQIEEYRRGSEYIKAHKSLLLKTVATTLVQMLALYSITYFVYCALGGTAVSWFTMMTLQAVLTVGVSVVPLPGGTGAGEGGFRLMFAQLFLGGTLMPGMLISRGLSFYLGMILAGIVILIAMIGKSRRGLFFSCRIKHLLTASL